MTHIADAQAHARQCYSSERATEQVLSLPSLLSCTHGGGPPLCRLLDTDGPVRSVLAAEYAAAAEPAGQARAAFGLIASGYLHLYI
jgi:hypothetical protein